MDSTFAQPEAAVIAPLVLADRCDQDGVAQAFVVVVKDGLPLKLCAHHFNQHEPALIIAGWQVHEDIRNAINLKPTDGSEPDGELAD